MAIFYDITEEGEGGVEGVISGKIGQSKLLCLARLSFDNNCPQTEIKNKFVPSMI